jgi:ribokinase
MHNKKQQIIDMPMEKNYTIINENYHRKRYDMRVLNIGSMNIDFVYSVDHIILPGETEATGGMNVFLGGKGINQSMALAKAGVEVYHGGLIGEDGQAFLDACKEYGVNSQYIKTIPGKSGHTIIQVDKNAQNSILLFGGANQEFTKEFIDSILDNFTSEDILLLQNEVNLLSYIVDKAYEKGMQIALNPSPFNEKLNDVDLTKVSIFLLNEVEGGQITGLVDPDEVLEKMREMFPKAKIVLTLGKDGAKYAEGDQVYHQPIFKVKAVDTTAAGDTFTGYFLSGLIEGMDIPSILKMSAKASSIAVTRNGAVQSIPFKQEVLEALKEEC